MREEIRKPENLGDIGRLVDGTRQKKEADRKQYEIETKVSVTFCQHE